MFNMQNNEQASMPTVNLSTGSVHYSYMFELPSGKNGFQPSLGLRYAASVNNSVLGVGFAFEGLHSLCKLPSGQWMSSQHGLLIEVDGNLVPKFGSQVVKFVSNQFGYSVQYGNGKREVLSKANQPDYYHLTALKSSDQQEAIYTYNLDDVLTSIQYSVYTITLSYGNRPDPFIQSHNSLAQRLNLRLNTISLQTNYSGADELIRSWFLDFNDQQGRSFLASITETGHRDGTDDISNNPTTFNWHNEAFLPELVVVDHQIPADADLIPVQWFGKGKTDFLVSQNGMVSVHPSLGDAGFGQPTLINNPPIELSYQSDATFFGDVNGRGVRDLLVLSNAVKGVYAFNPGKGFGEFASWAQFPLEALDENSQFLDLNADGVVDFMVADPLRHQFRIYLNGEAGWSNTPITKPMGEFDINLATNGFITRLSGSVYQDLVKVIGDKLIVAAGSGPLQWREWEEITIPLTDGLQQLNPECLHFADLTNTGVNDLILQVPGALYIWCNLGTGEFSAPVTINVAGMAEGDALLFDDFIGQGSNQVLIRCSQTQSLKRMSLLSRSENGLLKSVDNGSGSHANITYASSTTIIECSANALLPSPRLLAVARRQEDTVSGGVWDDHYDYDEPFVTSLPQYAFSFGSAKAINYGDDQVAAKLTQFHYIAPPFNTSLSDKEISLIGAIKHWDVAEYDVATGTPGKRLTQTDYEWEAVSVNHIISRRMRENVRYQLDEQEQPYASSRIVIEAYDDHGNIHRVRSQHLGRSHDDSPYEQISTMHIDYAAPINRQTVDRPTLVQKRDKSGSLLSASAYVYDGQPFGVVGTAGVITEKYTYVFSDAQVQKYFHHLRKEGLNELGYLRITGQPGYWRRDANISSNGNRKTIINPLGHATEITFDKYGLFETNIVDAMQSELINRPDHLSMKPLETTAANGQTKSFDFDALGRTQATYFPGYGNPVEITKYSESGALNVITTQSLQHKSGDYVYRERYLSGSGNVNKTVLTDGQTELIVQQSLAGARGMQIKVGGSESGTREAVLTITEYDALDRPTKVTKPNRHVITYQYIGPNQKIFEMVNGSMELKRTVYHLPNGKVGKVNVVDPTAPPIIHSYDALDQLIRTESTLQLLRETEHDAVGRILATLDPDHGLRVLIHDATDNQIETRRHLAEGMVPASLDHTYGIETVSCIQENFNASGQRAESYIAGGETESINYRYGENGYLGANLPTSIISPAGKVSYSYTEDNRIASQTMEDAFGQARLGLSFEHLPNGNLAGITYIDHKRGARRHIRYEYDSLGRIASIPGHIKRISYDAKGMVESIKHHNGLVTSTSWGDDNVSMASIAITGSDENLLFNEGYDYDDGGRLAKVTRGDEIIEYKRDPLSRIIEISSGANRANFSYNSEHYLTELPDFEIQYVGGRPSRIIDKGTGQKNHCEYDGYGRLNKKGDTLYRYNSINQLTSIDVGVNYKYDHQAQPALAYNDEGLVTRYAPDPRIFATDQGVFGCIMMGNQVLAIFRVDIGESFGVHVNRHGDVVMVSDPNGTPSFTRKYSPYGSTDTAPANGQTIDYHAGFEGNAYEPASQLYHYGGRVYDPNMGMFLSPDPLVASTNNPLAYNRYMFGMGDPLMAVDPTGLLFGWLSNVGDWISENFVEILAVVVIVVLIMFPPAGIAMGQLLAGMAVGGAVGAYTAHQNGQSILSGFLVGAALGGLGAWGATAAVNAAGYATAQTLSGLMMKGVISGAVTGAAMGVATSYAAGARKGEELLGAALVGAGVGAITGGLFGAADYHFANMKNPFESVSKTIAETTREGFQGGGQAARNHLVSKFGNWAGMTLHPYIFQSSISYIVGPMLLTSSALLSPNEVRQLIEDQLEDGINIELYKKEW